MCSESWLLITKISTFDADIPGKHLFLLKLLKVCLKTHEGKGAAVVLGSHHLVIHSFVEYLLSPVCSIRDNGTVLVDRTLSLLSFWSILVREDR